MIRRQKDQSGMASIVVVGILITLLSLISLGFAKIMSRAVQNSINNETAYSANYAAQSGINDVATWLRDPANINAKATHCTDLIGTDSQHKGPFWDAANISGDNNARYTCILLNQRPDTLVYDSITSLKSKVIKLTTDSTTGSTDSFMFSWHSTVASKTSLPAGSSPGFPNLINETNWNSSNYVPILRVTLYPVTTDGSIGSTQASSKTFCFYPVSAGGQRQVEFDTLADGSLQAVTCSNSAAIGSFNGTPIDVCNVVIDNLVTVPSIDYYYARITPIYGDVGLSVKANDIDNRVIKFIKVQAVVDVTAKAGPAAKRLQARVDLGGLDGSGGLVPSPNISPAENAMPDFALRTAEDICKKLLLHNGAYNYISNAEATNCPTNDLSVTVLAPNISSLSITGSNGPDGGKKILSDSNTPTASQKGTSYIGVTSNSVTIDWATSDAESCDADSSSNTYAKSLGWQNQLPLNITAGTANGTGQKTLTNLTSVAVFVLKCTGPGGVQTKTVTAWPPPSVTISSNSSVYVGDTITVTWTPKNDSSCVASGTSGWSGSKDPS